MKQPSPPLQVSQAPRRATIDATTGGGAPREVALAQAEQTQQAREAWQAPEALQDRERDNKVSQPVEQEVQKVLQAFQPTAADQRESQQKAFQDRNQLDDAIEAARQALCSRDTDSDWMAALAAALVQPSTVMSVRRILAEHGWMGTQFHSPPNRLALLQHLEQAKSLKADGGLADSNATVVAVAAQRPCSGKCSVEAPLPQPPQRPVRGSGSQHPVPGGCSPLDDDDSNIQRVPEYASEIFDQMFREEAEFVPRPNYMETQTDINGKMRTILVDWLVEVHLKYRLRPETLFLSVNIIDRVLTQMHVMRTRLQLVGIVAMFIAAKYEEIDPPRVSDFVYITDSAYTKEDVLIMECTVLTTLDFQISTPTAMHFLDRLQRVNRCDETQKEVSHYLLELALLDLRMIRYRPSHLAAAALLLCNEFVGRRPAWTSQAASCARASEGSLRVCADELRALLEAAPSNPLQAVRKKYSKPQRKNVAKMAFPPAQ